MQEHSAIGEHILMRVDTYADIAKIVRFHHERIDGEGYPDGLRETRSRCCHGSSLSPMPTTR